MEFFKENVQDGHIHLGEILSGTSYNISVTHDSLARFIIEVLDEEGNVLYRPNKYSVTALPNIPYSIIFVSPFDGLVAIHYYEKGKETMLNWNRVYNITIEQEENNDE
jgi:hypothetical protein